MWHRWLKSKRMPASPQCTTCTASYRTAPVVSALFRAHFGCAIMMCTQPRPDSTNAKTNPEKSCNFTQHQALCQWILCDSNSIPDYLACYFTIFGTIDRQLHSPLLLEIDPAKLSTWHLCPAGSADHMTQIVPFPQPEKIAQSNP